MNRSIDQIVGIRKKSRCSNFCLSFSSNMSIKFGALWASLIFFLYHFLWFCVLEFVGIFVFQLMQNSIKLPTLNDYNQLWNMKMEKYFLSFDHIHNLVAHIDQFRWLTLFSCHICELLLFCKRKSIKRHFDQSNIKKRKNFELHFCWSHANINNDIRKA